MPKLPQVSGDRLAAMLLSLGYTLVRQRGSHMRLVAGAHRITIPAHRTVAKGTLSDILAAVSTATGPSRDELTRRLR